MYDAKTPDPPLNDANLRGIFKDSAALRIGNHPVGRGGFRLRRDARCPMTGAGLAHQVAYATAP